MTIKWNAANARHRVLKARVGSTAPDKVTIPYLRKLKDEINNWKAAVMFEIARLEKEERDAAKALKA